MIYFLECVEAGAVKIGYARNELSKRIRQLQCGCPFELRFVGAINGTKADEANIHRAIGVLHGGVRGEWFRSKHAHHFLRTAQEIGLTAAIGEFQAKADAVADAIQVRSRDYWASLRDRGILDLTDLANAALRDPAVAEELHEFADYAPRMMRTGAVLLAVAR